MIDLKAIANKILELKLNNPLSLEQKIELQKLQQSYEDVKIIYNWGCDECYWNIKTHNEY